MARQARQTFKQLLLAVALRNVQTLEYKARTASSLAETYPENAAAFRAIESEAIQQMFRILVNRPWIGDARATVGSWPDRELAGARVAAN